MKALKLASVLFVYLLLLLAALYLGRMLTKESPVQNELPPEAFYPVDPSLSIQDNSAYAALDRSVYYTNYGTGEALTEENHQKVGVASSFFYRYFDHIINGNASAYRSMLTEAFIEEFDPPKDFAVQMLYDIRVDQSHSASTATFKGETVNVYHFSVSYKIFENNGTFRRDIASNQSVTQYYDLVYYKDQMLLNNISDSRVVSAEEVSSIRTKRMTVDLCVIGVFIIAPVIGYIVLRKVKRKNPVADTKCAKKPMQKR